jgi:Ca2+-binding RTX toxin-like protein
MTRKIFHSLDSGSFLHFSEAAIGELNNDNLFINYGLGHDVLIGGNGTDVFVLKTDRYADTIVGGAGNDWVDYNQSWSGVTVDLEAGVTALNGLRPVVVTHLSSIENAVGTLFNDVLIGNSGNNILDGHLGLDIASYVRAESGVDIDLENGIVEGDATGTDTLRRIEGAEGSDYDDTYDARGFSSTSLNAGSFGTYNVFEGRGGDDEIWGNGNTLVSYEHATAGVEVDLDDGEVEGNASVGEDELHNVNAVQGSAFNDTFKASDDADTFVFKGQFGHDTIEDFQAGNGGDHDVLLFTNTSVHSFQDLMLHATEDGDDVTIAIDGFGSVTLEDVSLHDLSAQNFDFA